MDSHDDEERNFCCLYLLLVRVGISYLRTYFKREWDSTDGHKRWSDCLQDGADLMRLWKPKTLAYENPKVLSGDTSKWDLSLFIKILLPRMAKKGAKKALEKLKDLRNALCHTSDAKISNGDFKRKWNDACNALTLFGAKSEDFQSIKRDVKNNLAAFTKWLAQELERLHRGQLELLLGQEKGQLVLQQGHDEIQESQKLLHQKLCEMQNTQHTIQRLVETICANQLPEEPRQLVANELPFNFEGKMLAKHLKEYYQTGERAILLPLPWMERNQSHYITNIYTTTEIVDMDATHQVMTLEELFTKAKTGPNNVRRILIEGEPGIGKTALCKKIAYVWSTKNNAELFPNVDLVLSLKCREFHTGDDLWDAIGKQNFTEAFHEKRPEIFKYITNNQSNVLLLLDGYDEIPGNHKDRMTESIHKLITRQLLPDSYVIVTRRPGQDLKLRNQFDKKLEIKGFNLDDSFSFIRDFFSCVPKTAETTISFVKKDNDVKDLVRNPLYTAILCLVLEAKMGNGGLYLNQLYKGILFSVTKRYHFEKLEEEVKDDCLLNEVQDILSKLGKISSKLITEERSDLEENELMAILTPSIWEEILGRLRIHRSRRSHSGERVSRNRGDDAAPIREFLVFTKPTDKLRSVSCYSFPKSLKAEHLAALAKFKSNLNFIDSAACIRFRMFVYSLCIQAKRLMWSVILAFLSTVLAMYLNRTWRFLSNQELNV